MKSKYFICVFFAVGCILSLNMVSKGQGYIHLDGKQFIDENGQPFYPMIMCYYADLGFQGTSSFDPNDTYLAQARIYGATNDFDYINVADGPNRILQDFYEMKNLGFNVVRMVFPIFKKPGIGFYYNVSNFSLPHWDPAFYHQVDVSPPYDSFNSNLVFFFNKYLELANLASTAGIKIWIDLSSNHEKINGLAGSTQVSDYRDLFVALAKFIFANNVHNLFAYEFYGEPTYGEHSLPSYHSKSEICEIVDEWNSHVKCHDPKHLTTIGVVGLDDPFQGGWDPNLISVDFINVHFYPVPQFWEYQQNPNTFLQKETTRYKDLIYIYNQCLKKPFVITETSFPGDDQNGNPYIVYPIAVYGDEAAQQTFLEETFPIIKNTEASGYGWWEFQNKYWYEPPPPVNEPLANYSQGHFGLMRYGNPDDLDLLSGYENATVQLRKLAATKFIDYKNNPPPMPGNPDYGPVSPTVEMSEHFYNPYNHPVNGVVFNGYYGTLTGSVKDQLGNPIRNAIVRGTSYVTNLGPRYNFTPIMHAYHTYTDENGNFEIRAYDYDPGTHGNPDDPNDPNSIKDNIIEDLKIAAYSSDMLQRGWNGLTFQAHENFILNSLQSEFDKVIDNVTVLLGTTQNFKGISKLKAINVLVDGNTNQGGNSEFKARNDVELKPGFHAKWGSEVHIFNEPIFVDCSDISTLGFRQSNTPAENIISSTSVIQKREVEINFYSNINELRASIYPNPNTGEFHIKLFGDVNDYSLNSIHIKDYLGKEILNKQFIGIQLQLSLTSLHSGIYFMHIQSGEKRIIQKFVIL